MSGKPKICGVILAAGESTRMGMDKALLPWPPVIPLTTASANHTLLSAAILALKPFTKAVVVVAGRNADNLVPIVSPSGAELVRNSDPGRGQFSSLQVGLRHALALGCDAAMITPVDCPPLSAATLERLHTAFELAISLGHWGVAPESGGKHGHPLLASRKLIDAFLSASSSSSAREIKRAHAHHIQYVGVPDHFVRVDVNTPEEYAALLTPLSEKTR
jgi:molybdenum cofactor cytidylyltransferase